MDRRVDGAGIPPDAEPDIVEPVAERPEGTVRVLVATSDDDFRELVQIILEGFAPGRFLFEPIGHDESWPKPQTIADGVEHHDPDLVLLLDLHLEFDLLVHLRRRFPTAAVVVTECGLGEGEFRESFDALTDLALSMPFFSTVRLAEQFEAALRGAAARSDAARSDVDALAREAAACLLGLVRPRRRRPGPDQLPMISEVARELSAAARPGSRLARWLDGHEIPELLETLGTTADAQGFEQTCEAIASRIRHLPVLLDTHRRRGELVPRAREDVAELAASLSTELKMTALAIDAALADWADSELTPEGVLKTAVASLGSARRLSGDVERMGEVLAAVEEFDDVVVATPPARTEQHALPPAPGLGANDNPPAPVPWRAFDPIGWWDCEAVSDAVAAAIELENAGDREGAEAAYRAAADTGDPDGAERLAYVLADAGRNDEAEERFRQAAADGDPRVLNNLGRFLRNRGREHEAEEVFRLSVAGRHHLAFANLGALLADRADGLEEEAEALYREAVECGDAHGMNNLGCLKARRGDHTEALGLFERAAAAGVNIAWKNLGISLAKTGARGDAEKTYRRAAALGVRGAAYALGRFLSPDPARRAEAEHWYRAAIDEGDRMGHCGLAHLLEADTDRAGEVEAHLQAAIAAGVGHCRWALAQLLERQGRTSEARGVLRFLASEGDAAARRRLVTLP